MAAKKKKKGGLPVGVTRFTKERTAFNGFRTCRARNGHTFTRYYSVNELGGVRRAKEAAVKGNEFLEDLFGRRNTWRAGRLTKKAATMAVAAGFSLKYPSPNTCE